MIFWTVRLIDTVRLTYLFGHLEIMGYIQKNHMYIGCAKDGILLLVLKKVGAQMRTMRTHFRRPCLIIDFWIFECYFYAFHGKQYL